VLRCNATLGLAVPTQEESYLSRLQKIVAEISNYDTQMTIFVKLCDNIRVAYPRWNTMSLTNRLASIRDRPTGPRLVWNEQTSNALIARSSMDTALKVERNARDLRDARMRVAPYDRRIVFVDFCPGGVVVHRLDVGWIQQGICTFEYFSSLEQWETFQSISMGDLIVMKRDLKISQTTRLYAHGRVIGLELNENRDKVLLVNWVHEQEQIEVPMVVCHNMVKIQDIDEVEAAMPLKFWQWLSR